MAEVKTPELDKGFTEVPLDEGFKEVPLDSKPEEAGMLESAGVGALQGATMGFADEAEGAAKALGNEGDLVENYRKYRDLARKRTDEQENANPKSAFAGNLLGGAATMFLTRNPILAGIATGLGSSKADLTKGDIKGAAIDTGIGGVLGFGGKVLGNKLSKYFSPASREAASSAQAAKAAGIVENPMKKTGSTLLEKGALEGGTEGQVVLNKLQPLIDKSESSLQKSLLEAEQALSQKSPEEIASRIGDAGDKVMDTFGQYTKRLSNTSDQFQKQAIDNVSETVMDYANKIKQAGNSPSQLNEIKRGLYREIQSLEPKAYDKLNPQYDLRDKVAVLKQVNSIVRQQIELLGDEAGGNLGQIIKKTNNDIGNLVDSSKQLTKNMFSPADDGSVLDTAYKAFKNPIKTVVTGVGDAIGVPQAQLGMAKANKALAKRLNTGVGEAVQEIVPRLGQQAPIATIPELPSKTPAEHSKSVYYSSNDELKMNAAKLSQNPEFKTLSDALVKAIDTNDSGKKNAVLFSIMQNPKARELMK